MYRWNLNHVECVYRCCIMLGPFRCKCGTTMWIRLSCMCSLKHFSCILYFPIQSIWICMPLILTIVKWNRDWTRVDRIWRIFLIPGDYLLLWQGIACHGKCKCLNLSLCLLRFLFFSFLVYAAFAFCWHDTYLTLPFVCT